MPSFRTLTLLLVCPVSISRYHSAVLMTIGGDGPKLIDLLQMREKYLLQDRIELLGPIRHKDVLSVRLWPYLFLFVFPFQNLYSIFLGSLSRVYFLEHITH